MCLCYGCEYVSKGAIESRETEILWSWRYKHLRIIQPECMEQNIGPLQERSVFLTANLSLQPPNCFSGKPLVTHCFVGFFLKFS